MASSSSAPVKYGSEEGAKLPFTKVDFTYGWSQNSEGKKDDGFVVTSQGVHNTANYIINQLVAFDMMIEPGTNWPSIAFCDKGEKGDFTADDCYMFSFKNAYIELQKWNSGKRTMIFGDVAHSPVGGFGYPNTEENKVFEMTYRRVKGGRPFYVQMKVSRSTDDDRFIVIAIQDIDEQVRRRIEKERRQEEEYGKLLEQAK